MEHFNLHGQHNYDATPFGILGSKVEIHEMSRQRGTWAAHTKTGYCLGPAWEHYRCHIVWVQDTRLTRIGQTVFFRHKYLTKPQVTEADALLRASDQMCSALLKTNPNSNETQRAVDLLVIIFKKKAQEAITTADKRREQRANAQAQRVETEDGGTR